MKSFVALIIITFLIQSINVNGQHGVASPWTANVELPTPPGSNSVRGFLYSNMSVLSNGKRIVVLNKVDGPGGIFITHSYDGINWTMPQLFGPDSLVVGLNSPKLVSDQNDNIHVIWGSQAPKVLFYTKMDSALNIIYDSVRIADNPAFNSFHDMYLTVDLQDRIHVMWNEGETGTDLPESYYSRSTDGGVSWSIKDSLSTHDNIPSSFPRGQFSAYAGDTLAVFWRDSSTVFSPSENWDLQMVVSEDGGVSWGTPVTINSNINMQGDPDLVIDPQGRFHLFYHEAAANDPYWGMRILYGYSDDLGATWSPSMTFNDTISLNQRSYLAEGSRYDIQNNVLWTFWKEEDMLGLAGGDMMAAFSTDRGVSWSAPEYVTDRNDSTIGFKSVALLPNGGLAINYELPNSPDSGLFRVYYKERAPIILSVPSLENEENIVIYPNPTSGKSKILFGTLKVNEIEVYSMSGQLIYSKKMNNTVTFNNLDITLFPKGIYIVKIRTEDNLFIKKVVKQ